MFPESVPHGSFGGFVLIILSSLLGAWTSLEVRLLQIKLIGCIELELRREVSGFKSGSVWEFTSRFEFEFEVDVEDEEFRKLFIIGLGALL